MQRTFAVIVMLAVSAPVTVQGAAQPVVLPPTLTEVHDSMIAKELSHSFGWDVGYAWNVNERWALGGTVGYEFGEASRRRTAALRVRRWITDDIAFELAPGVFRLTEVGGGANDASRA